MLEKPGRDCRRATEKREHTLEKRAGNKENTRGGLLLFAAALLIFTVPITTVAQEGESGAPGVTERRGNSYEQYRGPVYRIALLPFRDTFGRGSLGAGGAGEAAVSILKSMLKETGLDPVIVTGEDMNEQAMLINFRQPENIEGAGPWFSDGFDSVDYTIAGALTVSTEHGEGSGKPITRKGVPTEQVTIEYDVKAVSSGRSVLAGSATGEVRQESGGTARSASSPSSGRRSRERAIRRALMKIVSEVRALFDETPFQSRIVLISGNDIIIRGGERSRLAPGTVLAVTRSGRRNDMPLGTILLTAHRGEWPSVTRVRSGEGFKEGDRVTVVEEAAP